MWRYSYNVISFLATADDDCDVRYKKYGKYGARLVLTGGCLSRSCACSRLLMPVQVWQARGAASSALPYFHKEEVWVRESNCQIGSQVDGVVFDERQNGARRWVNKAVMPPQVALPWGLTAKAVQIVMVSSTSGGDILPVVQHSTAGKLKTGRYGTYNRTASCYKTHTM